MINRWHPNQVWKNLISRIKDSLSDINWGGIWLKLIFPFLLTTFLLIFTSGCDTTATDCSSDTFLVTTTEDISDGRCNDHCTLREAVAAANTCSRYDLYAIDLPAGTYTLSLRGPGDDRGDLNILSTVSIYGDSPATTIIKGNSSWNNRIIAVDTGAVFHLEDLSIEGGNLEVGLGGGVHNQGILTMRNVHFKNNEAMIGGGLFNAFSATLNLVQFLNNEAMSPTGLSPEEEEIYRETELVYDCGGGIANIGDMLLTDGTFKQNIAEAGGALCNGGRATLHIRQSQIHDNWTSSFSSHSKGGGIYNSGFLTLHNTLVTANLANLGGGIYQGGPVSSSYDFSDSGLMRLDYVIVEANTADPIVGTAGDLSGGQGGGLYIDGGRFEINHVNILDNQAWEGGGLYLLSDGEIANTSIAYNEATALSAGISEGKGGGIYGEGDVDIYTVTISSNLDDFGGGAAYITGGTFLFFQGTVAFNSAPSTGGSVGGIEITGGRATFWNSLITGAVCDSSPRSGFEFHADSNICDADASSYILPTLTEDNGQLVHVLLASSPAIDQLHPGDCPAYDQRDMERPQGDLCDVGAYEFAPMVLSGELGSPTLNRDVLCWAGPGPLYDTVSSVIAGTQVTLLGRTIEMNWWIIDNPRYPGVPCWLPGDALDVPPDFDLASLQYMVAPLLPTIEAPTGCLYQGPNDQVPSCYGITQCPVPFDQSLGACTP